MEENFIQKSTHLRPARIGLSFLILVIGILVLGFLGMVSWYWWQIKQGTAVAPANFSFSARGPVKSGSVDRNKIESGLNPFLIRSSGPLTIVEFMDYKCPFSKTAAPIMDQIVAKYGSKVNIIVRNFPGESIYPGSRELSKFAYCAFKQNRFLKVYDYLFEHQQEISQPLTDDLYSSLTQNLDLRKAELATCVNDPATEEKINNDLYVGVDAGVRGTPTFFVNGQKFEGTVSFEAWERYIKSFK